MCGDGCAVLIVGNDDGGLKKLRQVIREMGEVAAVVSPSSVNEELADSLRESLLGNNPTKRGGGMCTCGGVDDGFCDGVECGGGVSPEMAKKIMAARQSDSDAGIDKIPVTDEVAKLVEEGRWRPTPH